VEIIQKDDLDEAEARQIINESKENFSRYFNKGWVKYRKSVMKQAIGLPLNGPDPERYSRMYGQRVY
jgi:hypothetical protein